MNYDTLIRAMSEAERFLRAARKVQRYKSAFPELRSGVEGGAKSAATKRASLDLTKALADLRLGR